MPTKQDFANFLLGLPGAAAYFGADKITAWVNGQIASANYDMLFAWFNQGNTTGITNWVNAHTSGVTKTPDPGFTNSQKVEDLQAAVDLLQDEVNRIQENIQMYVAENNPDSGALAVLEQNLQTSTNALNKYKQYMANAQQNIK